MATCYVQVIKLLESRGVTIRVATEKLIAEEAPESYKDVSQVGAYFIATALGDVNLSFHICSHELTYAYAGC